MFGFLAFVWLNSREGWNERQREDDSGVILALVLVPLVWTLLFAYMLYCGLSDVGLGRPVAWALSFLSVASVVSEALAGRWTIALGVAFGTGLVGVLLVLVGAYLRARLTPSESEDSSDGSGPRWRFS